MPEAADCNAITAFTGVQTKPRQGSRDERCASRSTGSRNRVEKAQVVIRDFTVYLSRFPYPKFVPHSAKFVETPSIWK
jgi:hypothetical protein